MPMVYPNLHKSGAPDSASFLQQPVAAEAREILRDLDRPAAPEDSEALNGMNEWKAQMPMAYLSLHKSGAPGYASFLQQPAAAEASEILRGPGRPVPAAEAEALIGIYRGEKSENFNKFDDAAFPCA
jgi:hypothetical protein